MCCLMMRNIHTHIDAVLVVVVVLMKIYIYIYILCFFSYSWDIWQNQRLAALKYCYDEHN
jgi:hypothetical protein